MCTRLKTQVTRTQALSWMMVYWGTLNLFTFYITFLQTSASDFHINWLLVWWTDLANFFFSESIFHLILVRFPNFIFFPLQFKPFNISNIIHKYYTFTLNPELLKSKNVNCSFSGKFQYSSFHSPVKAFQIDTALLVPKVTLGIRLNKQRKRKEDTDEEELSDPKGDGDMKRRMQQGESAGWYG